MRALGVRVMLLAATAAALTVLTSSPSQACSCVDPGVAHHIRHADVIVTAVVDGPHEITPLGRTSSSARPVRYNLAVDRVYKGGPVDDVLVVQSAASGVSCGWEFRKPSHRYLVFATRSEDGVLRGGLCDGTALATPALIRRVERLTHSSGDAADLPARRDGSIVQPDYPSTPWLAGIGAGAVLLSGLATLWLWRRRVASEG